VRRVRRGSETAAAARLCAAIGLLCGATASALAGDPRVPGRRSGAEVPVALSAYAGRLADGWVDFGWAPHDVGSGPAAIDFSDSGGWIVGSPKLSGRWGGVVFRYRAPATFGEFLEVRLDSPGASALPRVRVGPEHRRDLADGWSEVLVSMDELNPRGVAFDRIVLRACRAVGRERVLVDGLGFAAAAPVTAEPARPPPLPSPAKSAGEAGAARAAEIPPPPLPPEDVPTAPEVRMSVDCRAPARRIDPMIYGIAYDPRLDGDERHQWELGATARRWGGNASSRYNWQLGNAWNTASDWFFRNVNYTDRPDFSYEHFLDDDLAHGMRTTLTVPLIGWVAKDRESYSFPVARFGAQRRTDPARPDAGDGTSRDGKPLAPGDRSATSIAVTPAWVGRWVSAIRARDERRGQRSVHQYILDNEPMLWNSTHRDVHPEPVGYDELLRRTLEYASEVRRADPQGVIAGPALWGWPAYQYSAVDAALSFRLRPDRRAHGDVPLLPWYLQQLAEHERRTGERLLDVVDVHFYPQGSGLSSGTRGATDPETNARRIRSVRALWDPEYVDESWIGEAVRLVPRLREWIAANYPGRRIQLGEYSFGAENHPSGGIALAEALGRFGQQGVDSAFYWTYPARDSYAFWAFRAYRNFDGHGGHFQDWSVPARASGSTSLFASRDDEGRRLVLVALNTDPVRAGRARIDVSSCGSVARRRAFVAGGDRPGLAESATAVDEGAVVSAHLAPYSINVFDLELAQPAEEKEASTP